MKEISIALGGGGIKGIAHVGVLRKIEEAGFTIKAIAGTSAGGLVGAIYAAGFSTDEIEKIILQIDQGNLFHRHRDDGPAIMGLHGVAETIAQLLGNKTFNELKIPFACTAVDLHRMREVILTEGRVVDALLATIAMPGIFPPKEIGSSFLVDGGVLDPVPVAVARWLADNVPTVGVCLSPPPEDWANLPPFTVPPSSPIPAVIIDQFSRLRIGQAIKIFIQSIDITSRMIAELRLKVDQPDVLIRPELDRFGTLDKVNPAELITEGEIATAAALEDINRSFSFRSSIQRRLRKSSLPGDLLAGVETETLS